MNISTPIQAASIGMADSLILMVLALVVFGPRRLPQMGRQIGKLMYEFRKASNDFKFQMEEELRNAEEADRRKRDEAERQQTLTETQKAAALAQSAAESALNAAAEIKSAQAAAQTETPAPEVPHDPVSEAEPVSAESGLRVQPPTTGEQVAAARPGRAAVTEEVASLAPESDSTDSSASPVEKIEPASEERPATESTAHHG
jgi:sec-independent protein translocase protein TatB